MGAECSRCGNDIYDECHYCKVKDERDRYRAALESIAATEAAMVPGVRWVHWRTQAEEALS